MSGPQIIQVANELELNQAIATVDGAGAGDFIIQFTANITEGTDTGSSITFNGNTLSAPADLYALNLKGGVSLSINGGGYTLAGANIYRGLFAYSARSRSRISISTIRSPKAAWAPMGAVAARVSAAACLSAPAHR